MTHSSLSPEFQLGPEPDRPRSAFVSAMLLLGICSALVLAAPGLIRSFQVLLMARAPGSVMPSLLEVFLALLGMVALASVIMGVVTDLRARLGGGRRGRRGWRRHRQPWEEYLMESEAPPPRTTHSEFPAASHYRSSAPHVAQARSARATLRLVEPTPWPLGQKRSETQARRQHHHHSGRAQPLTQLGMPAAPRPVTQLVPRQATFEAPAPTYQTPYPFSVWSFHDNQPDFYEEHETTEALAPSSRLWLLATFIGAGAVMVGLMWLRARGIALPFSR